MASEWGLESEESELRGEPEGDRARRPFVELSGRETREVEAVAVVMRVLRLRVAIIVHRQARA